MPKPKTSPFSPRRFLLHLSIALLAATAMSSPAALAQSTKIQAVHRSADRPSAPVVRTEKDRRLDELLSLMARLINQRAPIQTTETIDLRSAEIPAKNVLRLDYTTGKETLSAQEKDDFSRDSLKRSLCQGSPFSNLLADGARLELRLFDLKRKRLFLTESFTLRDCPGLERQVDDGNIFKDKKALPKFVAEFNKLCPLKLDSTLEVLSLSMPTATHLRYRLRYTRNDPALADPVLRKRLAATLETQMRKSGCSALNVGRMSKAGLTVSYEILDSSKKKIASTRFKPSDCHP